MYKVVMNIYGKNHQIIKTKVIQPFDIEDKAWDYVDILSCNNSNQYVK